MRRPTRAGTRWIAMMIVGALGCVRPSSAPPTEPRNADPDIVGEPPPDQATPAIPGPDRPAGADDVRDDTGPGVLHDDLNARYREETDVAAWKRRFERRDREVANKRDAIVDELALKPGMRVADIGAGTGLYTFELSRRVGPKGTVYAVDVQDYFLTHLRQEADKKKLANVRTIEATQRSPQLPAGSIDLAFLCDAYHHIEHPAPYLGELFDAIVPGGRLVIVDFAKHDRASAFIRDHIRATPDQFRAEIEAAGFRFERAWDGLDENFMFVFTRPAQ